jgi:gluconate:H+ symporter, GntP family
MHLFCAITDPGAASLWPFAVLAIAVAFIVVAIAVLRVHAFLSLILAAFLVGLLSVKLPELPGRPEAGHLIRVVEWTMIEFGKAAGNIGFAIALASIIGVCLMESGAADKVVRRFMAVLGEKRAGIALLASGFFLSIPVFFDTVFFLLIPLARALALRAGKNYLLYVLAICGGGVITHSIVAPTPGPLIVVENLKLDLGLSIVAGVLAGILPAIGIWYLIKYLNARIDLPMRETAGMPLSELNAIVNKGEEELPSFTASVLPVVLPVALIALASFLVLAQKTWPGLVAAFGGPESFAIISRGIEFFGNKNIALLIGTVIALWVLARQKGLTMAKLGEVMSPPLETAGVIILITSAGGAFGAMIRHSGVGDSIKLMAGGGGMNYVLLAWLITAVVRVAQGSATVAMITASAIMYPIMADGLPFHPMYIFLAIGFGSMIFSWMNDSGFWVVGRLSGFTEKETLKTWTVLVTAISVIGLVETLLFSWIIPNPF